MLYTTCFNVMVGQGQDDGGKMKLLVILPRVAFCNLPVLTSILRLLAILLKSHSYSIFIKFDLGLLVAVAFFTSNNVKDVVLTKLVKREWM